MAVLLDIEGNYIVLYMKNDNNILLYASSSMSQFYELRNL